MAITVERLEAEINADPARAIAGLSAFDAALTAVTRDREVNIDIDRDSGLGSLMTGGAAVFNAVSDGLANVSNMAGSAGSSLSSMAGAAGGAGSALTSVGSAAGGAGGGFSAVTSGAGGAASAFLGIVTSAAGLVFHLGVLMSVLSVLPGAFAAVGAAAGALMAAVAPLVGLLGMIPVGIGAIGLGLGTAIMGFRGIGDAIGASNDVMKDGATATKDLASEQHALANALRNLADARRELAKAPHEAREHLEDLRFARRDAILAEKAAILDLRDAQKTLTQAQEKAARSGYEIVKQTDEFTGKVYEVAKRTTDASSEAAVAAEDEARRQLRLQQAQLNLAKAKDRVGDTTRDLNEAERKGIKNSDIMVAARRKVADAEWQVAQARKALAKAQKEETAAVTAYKDAMKELTPEGRNFVRFMVNEFIPAFNELRDVAQAALLPGIQDGLRSIMSMFGDFREVIRLTAEELGDSFRDFWAYWAKPIPKGRLITMFDNLRTSMRKTLDLGTPMSRMIVSITDAAIPAYNAAMDSMNAKLEEWADWMETDRGKRKMTRFFQQATVWGGRWMDVLRPIGGIFGSIIKAARPLARNILKDLAEYFGDLDDRLKKKEGFEALRDWFNDQLPTLRQIGGLFRDLGDLFFNSTKGGKDSAFYKALDAIRTDLIPPLKDFFTSMDETDFAPTMVSSFGALIEEINRVNWKALSEDFSAFVGFLGDTYRLIRNTWFWINKINDLPNDALGKKIGPSRAAVEESDKSLADHYNRVRNATIGLRDWMNEIGEPMFKWMGDGLRAAGRSMADYFGKDGRFRNNLRDFKQWVKDFSWSGAWNGMVQSLKDAVKSAKEYFKDNMNPKKWMEDALGNIPWAGKSPGGKWNPLNWAKGDDGRQFGGAVEKDKPYIVGEKRAEIFVPSTSGRIMPRATPSPTLTSSAPGYTDAQLEHILQRVLAEARPNQEINVETTNETDPLHVAKAIAWELA